MKSITSSCKFENPKNSVNERPNKGKARRKRSKSCKSSRELSSKRYHSARQKFKSNKSKAKSMQTHSRSTSHFGHLSQSGVKSETKSLVDCGSANKTFSIKNTNKSAKTKKCFSMLKIHKIKLEKKSRFSPVAVNLEDGKNSNESFRKLNNFQKRLTNQSEFQTPELNKSYKLLKNKMKGFGAWGDTDSNDFGKTPERQPTQTIFNLPKNILENIKSNNKASNEPTPDLYFDFDDEIGSIDSENFSTDDDNCFSHFEKFSFDNIFNNFESPKTPSQAEKFENQDIETTFRSCQIQHKSIPKDDACFENEAFPDHGNADNWQPSLYSKVVSYQNDFFGVFESKANLPKDIHTMNDLFDTSDVVLSSKEESCDFKRNSSSMCSLNPEDTDKISEIRADAKNL